MDCISTLKKVSLPAVLAGSLLIPSYGDTVFASPFDGLFGPPPVPGQQDEPATTAPATKAPVPKAPAPKAPVKTELPAASADQLQPKQVAKPAPKPDATKVKKDVADPLTKPSKESRVAVRPQAPTPPELTPPVAKAPEKPLTVEIKRPVTPTLQDVVSNEDQADSAEIESAYRVGGYSLDTTLPEASATSSKDVGSFYSDQSSEFTPEPQPTIKTTIRQNPVRQKDLNVNSIPAPQKQSEVFVPQHIPAMSAVNVRADELTRHAFSLAERGAFFAARAQFIQALRRISQALDALERTDRHSASLANGLRALRESQDFIPKGSRLEADLPIAGIVEGHETPVLKDDSADSISAVIALQRYYSYAQSELAKAAGGQPAAASALFGLGKLQTAFSGKSEAALELHGPKALAFHQAALLVNPEHHKAANELGVLLARYGELNRAAGALRRSLLVHPEAETWHNLAVVHERLGQNDLAQKARYEIQLLAQQKAPAANDASEPSGNTVQWLAPNEFAKTGPQGPPRPAAETPTAEAQKTNRSASWWTPWLKSR